MKRGQNFSIDAIIAVALFLVAAILLFYTAGPVATDKQSSELKKESKSIASTLSSEQNLTVVFIKGAKIDGERFAAAANLSYETLKSLLGVNSEFCIYLEDEKGNVVPMEGRVGIGSPLANISGRGCNATAISGS